MADPVQIQNKEEIAEEIGNNLSGSLKKIFDKMSSDQERMASVQKILNLEDKREKAVRDKALLDAIKGIKLDVNAIEKKDGSSLLELLGLGGLFSVLAGITATVGGITLGLGTDGALFRSSDLRKAFDNFKVKFPKFADDVTDFFNVGDDINEATKIATKAESVAKISDSKTLAKLVNNPMSELVTKVFGRVFSIAGNPVFDAIAMGKDAFDIFKAKTDDDVATNVMKEDVFAIIGGFLGGAIGAIGGPAGVALGVGLGNMAGEFVGSLMDEPEIIATIAKVKKELTDEKKNIQTTIEDLDAQLKVKGIGDDTRKLLESQRDALTKRKDSIDAELTAIEGLKVTEDELKKIDAEAKEIVARRDKLEEELQKAKDRNDAASIEYLQNQIEIANLAFEDAEKRYEKQSKILREQAQKTSAKLAETSTSFFDRMASEAGFIGGLFSLLGGEALEGDALENLKTANRNELNARKTELEAKIADDSIMSILFRSRYQKELRDIEGELRTMHTGGRITETGAIVAQKGEVIIDDVLVKGLEHSINFLAESARMMRESGSPVVINNVNNSQTNPVISNQATTVKVPDAVRSGEPSFGMAARAMMMN